MARKTTLLSFLGKKGSAMAKSLSKFSTAAKVSGRFLPLINTLFFAWTLYDVFNLVIGDDDDALQEDEFPGSQPPPAVVAAIMSEDYDTLEPLANAFNRQGMSFLSDNPALGLWYIVCAEYITSLKSVSQLRYDKSDIDKVIAEANESGISAPFSGTDLSESALDELEEGNFLSRKLLDIQIAYLNGMVELSKLAA